MSEPASAASESRGGLDAEMETARAVAREVVKTPGVHSLGTGLHAEAATYGRGDKVTGVVVENEAIRVHVVLEVPGGLPVPDTADRIRRRLIFLAARRPVNIVVEDLYLAENSPLPEGVSGGSG